MKSKWVILDAMGVVYEEGDDVGNLLVPFVQCHNESVLREVVEKAYYDASLGKISSREFWNQVGLGEKYPKIETMYLDECLMIDPEFLPITQELKKKYYLAMLSNDIYTWSQYLRTKFSIDDFFSCAIISEDVGLRKPDPKIFEFLLKQLNAKAEDCLFVDDNLYNLKTASKLGIKTVRFVRNAKKTPFCSEFEISSFRELKTIIEQYF